MLPSPDRIGVAAYHRWQRRGHGHGLDRRDWLAAEQELTFAMNYEVVARHRLDGVGPRRLGDPQARRCRFCEGSAPRVRFDGARPAIPASLGNVALFTLEECDECHAQFEESIGADLDRFAGPIALGDAAGPSAFVPVAAFKGLARAALAILPAAEIELFEAAIEWVGNPDHDLDSRTIAGMECLVHGLSEPSPFSWAAIARRSDDEMPFPYLLAFFGTGRAVFQIPLPLCSRDEEIEGDWTIPAVASPFGVGRGPLESRFAVVPLSSSRPASRPARLSFLPAF